MRKRTTALIAVAATAAVAVGGFLVIREARIQAGQCEFVASLETALSEPIGTGQPVTIVGDSYSQGFGLDDPRASWVQELPDTEASVHAASGAGFTRSGMCGDETIVDLARTAGGPMIIQAGLNDTDASRDDLAAAVDEALTSGDVLAVVGPTSAPNRDRADIAAVDAVLEERAVAHEVLYISALEWDLPFSDGLHLTPQGHATFGEMVAAELSAD